MSKLLATFGQFAGLIITIVLVAFLNFSFRPLNKRFNSQGPDAKNGEKIKNNLMAWRVTNFMAPGFKSLVLSMLVASLIVYVGVSLFTRFEGPSLVHENPLLAKAKDVARSNCLISLQADDYEGAYKSLLRDPDLLKLRSSAEEKAKNLAKNFPSVALTSAHYSEQFLKHVGPIAAVTPLLIYIIIRYLSMVLFVSENTSDFWTMLDELSILLITIVTFQGLASFLFFHFYVDGLRVQRCIHTSGHWYTWSVTMSCFTTVCSILFVVAFGKVKNKQLKGLNKSESLSVGTGLSITGRSVAEALFYSTSVWFALYTALTLKSLQDSQRIYHDTADALDGLEMSKSEIILNLIMGIIGSWVYVRLRNSQCQNAETVLTDSLATLLQAVEPTDPQPVIASHNNLQHLPSSPAPEDRKPLLIAPNKKNVNVSKALVSDPTPVEPPVETPIAPPLESSPQAPPPLAPDAPPLAPDAPPFSPAPPSIPIVRKSVTRPPPTVNKPTAEQLLDQLKRIQEKRNSNASADEAIQLSSGMPSSLSGNMMLALQYQGAKKRISLIGGGHELKSIVFEAVERKLSKLKALCGQHKINFIFVDLALLNLAIHFEEGHSKPSDSFQNFKCACSNSDNSQKAHDSDEFTE